MPSLAELLEKEEAKKVAPSPAPSVTPTDKTVSKPIKQPKVFEVRHTLPLPSDLLDHIESLTKTITRQRSPGNRKVRITSNTLIRAWLFTLRGRSFNLNEVKDEADLVERFKNV